MDTILYYDLETTNLKPVTGQYGVEILQIGARAKVPGQSRYWEYDEYLYPSEDNLISPGATAIHGLTEEKLCELNAREMTDGLIHFADFLFDITNNTGTDIILVAHNNYGFDAKVLKNNWELFGVNYPDNLYVYDSIEIMNRLKKNGHPIDRLGLDACLEYFFNESQGTPHDAYDDADNCRRISEMAAKELGYGSLRDYIDSMIDLKPFNDVLT